ncbi:hypothetical protein DF141_26410 [Burkholderia cenocepacia]|nr:hypothetical protein DF147_08315 [Burkholderia cenocepacia]RQU69014.1 hypothetical protein DF141_26410 [Burkholderia cenocepacia]RQU84727.1 hypothetical protein DF133_27380 [Burkholderia cenocepacia]RQV07979.1 hypothetical protein DF039_30120 [Burkholderia cenocepacia]RQV14162.1 hypothetical protein DF132_31285 [Burkholderia cenocepacia]
MHAQWGALYINQNLVSKRAPGGPLILAMAVTIGMLRECPDPRAAACIVRTAGHTRDRYNRSF